MPPRVPDHELFRCIGRGGYGEVWLARSVMGTYRAVKVVRRQSFEHDRPYEREFNGIKHFEPISRSHDSLMDILQVGRNDAEGYFYYVMEVADDELTGQTIDPENYSPRTLRSAITSPAGVTFDECIEWSLALCASTGHLHKHGLVHRDIKPANIVFINGVPKLADIGLVTGANSDTIAGGTLGYLAPEGTPSPRADLYALGKVIYEMATRKDRLDYPQPPTFWGDATANARYFELNEVFLRACADDPRRRYQSAEDLRADLVVLQSGKSVRRLRQLERRLRVLTRLGIAAAAAGLVVATAAWLIYRQNLATTRQLARSYIAYGTRSMEERDLLGSLPWFAQALQLRAKDAAAAHTDRTRLACVLRESPRPLRFWFQSAVINHASFNADGRRVVVADNSHNAIVWDMASNAPVARLPGHTKEVETACFTRDGQRVLTSSVDRTARLWETATGREIQRLPDHPETVYSAEFSPDEHLILTGCKDGRVRVWDADSLRLIKEFAAHSQPIRSARFSPDGRRVITASHDGTARIWDWQAGEPLGSSLAHHSGHWVYYAEFSPDGRRVATGSSDRTARVWDAATSRQMAAFEHAEPVRGTRFSPDGRLLVVSCNDFRARVYDVTNRVEAIPPLKHNSYVLHAAFSPDGTRVVTTTSTGVITLWDLAPTRWSPPPVTDFFSGGNGASNAPPPLGGREAVEIKSDGNGRGLVTFSPGGYGATGAVTVQMWDSEGRARSQPLRCDHAGNASAISMDGRVLANLAGDTVEIWDLSAGRQVGALPHTQTVSRVLMSAMGNRFFTLTTGGGFLWEPGAGRGPVELPLPKAVGAASFDPRAHQLAIVTGTNVLVWDAVGGKLLFTLPHDSPIEAVEFSPDGVRLVTCRSDASMAEREAQLWDARTGRRLGAPLRHRDGVKHASFSPDGRWIVTASEDFTAQVWTTASGRQLSKPLRHQGQAGHARFSPDGRWIVTAGGGGTRVWETNGEPITPLVRHPWATASVRFIGEGRHVLAKRSYGESILWELPADNRPIEDLTKLAELLSGHRIDASGSEFPLTTEELQAAWRQLQSRQPAQFEQAAGEVAQWHRAWAWAGEKDKQWFSALFHLERLLAAAPGDASLLARRDHARKQLPASGF
jgi:WD40 repeat protein